MSLSPQDRNLVCIYHSGSRVATAAQIREALIHIGEPDVRAAAESALRKLDAMSDEAFSALVSLEEALSL